MHGNTALAAAGNECVVPTVKGDVFAVDERPVAKLFVVHFDVFQTYNVVCCRAAKCPTVFCNITGVLRRILWFYESK